MKTIVPQKNFTNILPIAAILVASMGYFVDIYDLLLFSIVRLPSLKSLGLTGAQVTESGIFLLNVRKTHCKKFFAQSMTIIPIEL